jgi:hypothetical protein
MTSGDATQPEFFEPLNPFFISKDPSSPAQPAPLPEDPDNPIC